MLKVRDPLRVARTLPTWVFLVVPLTTFALASTDALLMASPSVNSTSAHWKLALVTTIPLSAAACALTVWILLRLQNEIDRRTETESQLRTALVERDQAIGELSEGLERERRLRRELDHRVRNNLSSLLGLVGLYEGSNIEPADLVRSLRSRIAALREVYGLISVASEDGVDLAMLLSTIAASSSRAGEGTTFEASGPAVHLSSREANALAMVVQELVTNASKHGALRTPGGVVRVTWSAQDVSDSARVHLRWVEVLADTPQVHTRKTGGLGLELVEGIVRSDLRGRVAFEAEHGKWVVDIVASIARPTARVPSLVRQEASTS